MKRKSGPLNRLTTHSSPFHFTSSIQEKLIALVLLVFIDKSAVGNEHDIVDDENKFPIVLIDILHKQRALDIFTITHVVVIIIIRRCSFFSSSQLERAPT